MVSRQLSARREQRVIQCSSHAAASLYDKIRRSKAENESQAEILELVGAARAVFPNREAAKRITPLLILGFRGTSCEPTPVT
ncbi:hypothetical protein ACYULU_06625 [Breznakiellaceae bacterium SP9]